MASATLQFLRPGSGTVRPTGPAPVAVTAAYAATYSATY